MTLDLISIAYAKSSTLPERKAVKELLATAAEARTLEMNLLYQWRLLKAGKSVDEFHGPSNLQSNQPKPHALLTYARRRNPGKDYVDLVDMNEREYERLRAECSLQEVLHVVLRSARWDFDRVSNYSNSVPESLNAFYACSAWKQSELVRLIEALVAENAA